MKQNRSSCFTLLLLFFVLFQHNILYAQFKINGDTTKNKKTGKIIYDKKSLRYFAVLMQDTSLIGNRFSNVFEEYRLNSPQIFEDFYYLPAFLVDSSLFVKCEKILLEKANNVFFSSQFNGLSKRKYKQVIRNSIHLYMGYLNKSNELIIVVNFVTIKQYKRYKICYRTELFMVDNGVVSCVIVFNPRSR